MVFRGKCLAVQRSIFSRFGASSEDPDCDVGLLNTRIVHIDGLCFLSLAEVIRFYLFFTRVSGQRFQNLLGGDDHRDSRVDMYLFFSVIGDGISNVVDAEVPMNQTQ